MFLSKLPTWCLKGGKSNISFFAESFVSNTYFPVICPAIQAIRTNLTGDTLSTENTQWQRAKPWVQDPPAQKCLVALLHYGRTEAGFCWWHSSDSPIFWIKLRI